MRKYLGLLFLLISINTNAQYANETSELLDNQYGFGARSIGMGSAYTGVADDYSAIYWNPAGLAQIKKMEIYAGLSHLKFSNDATFYGTQLSSDENFTKLSSIGLVFPVPTFRGSLVFALGYQRVKEFDKTLHFTGFNPNSNGTFFTIIEKYQTHNDTLGSYFDRNVQQEELIQQSGHLNNWSFAGSMDISPNVSVGVTLNFWTGTNSYMFDFLQTDTEDKYPNLLDTLNFDSYAISQKIIGDYSAFQLKLGALFRPNPQLRVGLTISLPTTYNIIEKSSYSDDLIRDDGETLPYIEDPDENEYDVSTPFKFDLGASYQLKDLLFSAGIEYADFSQIKFELPDEVGLDEFQKDLLDENKEIKNLFSDKLKLKAGIEYFWRDQNLVFRGGYLLDPSPLKDAPSEFNRNIITAGLGFVIDKQFIIDAAYMHGSWKNYSEDSYTPGGTEEDITYQKIFLTTSFRF